MSSRRFKHILNLFSTLDANIISTIVYIAPILLLFIPHLCYLLYAVPLIILFFEKQNILIKFHCIIAFILQLLYTIINITIILLKSKLIAHFIIQPFPIYWIKLISIFLTPVILGTTIIFVTLSIYSVICAYSFEYCHIPLISNIATKLSHI